MNRYKIFEPKKILIGPNPGVRFKLYDFIFTIISVEDGRVFSVDDEGVRTLTTPIEGWDDAYSSKIL